MDLWNISILFYIFVKIRAAVFILTRYRAFLHRGSSLRGHCALLSVRGGFVYTDER